MNELITKAVAQAWCSKENEHKEMDVVLAEQIIENISNMSTLVRDGVPTFYVDTTGKTCTHRFSKTDIPVWCESGDDGLRLMEIIDQL